MGSIPDDLLGPDVELIETHISWVFRHPDVVYKVKKPVDYGFLDFSSRRRRLRACHAEVRLNRRLAPNTYRGVVPITRGEDGVHRIGGDGPVVDHAVAMERLPDADRLDIRLEEGRLDADQVEDVARFLAAFHADCATSPEISDLGRMPTVRANVVENLRQTRASIARFVPPAAAAELQRAQLRFLDDKADRIAARADDGFVREGHGDLRLEHVYLADDGGITVIDCIEFNRRFRCGDVCADVAFLSMDLGAQHRVDLAEVFLAAYAEAAQDLDLYALVDFYEGYRAWVRAKVATFLADDAGAPLAVREASAAKARHFYLLALSTQRRPAIPPVLVAVGGVLATGKSTIAAGLRQRLGSPVIGTDRTRKHLLGVAATERVFDGEWQGAYTVDMTDRTYQEVFRRAGAVLRSGRPVVVDASFRSAAVRAGVRGVAAAEDVPFLFVECRCDPETSRDRLREREKGPSVSDGRLEIFDNFVASFETVSELPAAQHLVVDTDAPLDRALDTIVGRLPAWPAALTG